MLEWQGLDRVLLSAQAVVEHYDCLGFVNGITEKNLFVSATELAEQFRRATFIISGTDFYEHRDVHPNAVCGALSALIVESGVNVLRAEDVLVRELDAERVLEVLRGRRVTGNGSETSSIGAA